MRWTARLWEVGWHLVSTDAVYPHAFPGGAPRGTGLGCGLWAFGTTVEMANHGVSAGQGDKKGEPEEANAAPIVCFTTSNLEQWCSWNIDDWAENAECQAFIS